MVGGALALRTRRRSGDFFLVPGAKRASASEYPFSSCWVDTAKTFTQTYGRVEIRAKLPDHACPGVWPQHWWGGPVHSIVHFVTVFDRRVPSTRLRSVGHSPFVYMRDVRLHRGVYAAWTTTITRS